MELVTGIGGAIITNAPQLVGFILPPFVEILNRDVKRDGEKYLVSLSVCMLTAIVLHWNELAYGTPEQVITYAGVIFLESNTIYKLYFQKSYLRDVINQKIGRKEDVVIAPPLAPEPAIQ